MFTAAHAILSASFIGWSMSGWLHGHNILLWCCSIEVTHIHAHTREQFLQCIHLFSIRFIFCF